MILTKDRHLVVVACMATGNPVELEVPVPQNNALCDLPKMGVKPRICRCVPAGQQSRHFRSSKVAQEIVLNPAGLNILINQGDQRHSSRV